ncbi:hypothetical protein EDB87DRAFT_1573274 [Lactarius vividus]|nr:hypothetical protein EDB87DRAFT_1573274 [Lactarius vividus]
MSFFDIFGFCVSILGMYGAVVYLRCLLPRHIIPNVSAMLHDTQDTLARAVTTGAIPDISEPGLDLESFAGELAYLRIHSHRSPGLFQQIRLAVRHGFTYRLYSLSSQINAVRLRVELAMDEQRLALLAVPPNAVLTVVPIPASGIAKPTPPPPALVGLDSSSVSLYQLASGQAQVPHHFYHTSFNVVNQRVLNKSRPVTVRTFVLIWLDNPYCQLPKVPGATKYFLCTRTYPGLDALFLRHETYYSKELFCIAQVDGSFYCVHRFLFSRDSMHISARLGTHGREALTPVVSLGDVEREIFEAFLSPIMRVEETALAGKLPHKDGDNASRASPGGGAAKHGTSFTMAASSRNHQQRTPRQDSETHRDWREQHQNEGASEIQKPLLWALEVVTQTIITKQRPMAKQANKGQSLFTGIDKSATSTHETPRQSTYWLASAKAVPLHPLPSLARPFAQ